MKRSKKIRYFCLFAKKIAGAFAFLFLLCLLAFPSFGAGLTIPQNSTLNLNSATLSLPGSLTIEGILNMTTGTLELTGDWNNQGTFNAGNGTVKLVGIAGNIQQILGESAFYNLICSTGGLVLSFEASKTQTITNYAALEGTTGNLLILRSTASDGTRWKIAPPETRKIQYVNVKDSENLGATVIDPPNSPNDGNTNTIKWFLTSSGFISLSITRSGSDVKISWDPSGLSSLPDIYVLTGDGSGAYTNTTNLWVAITDTSVSANFDITNMPNGYFIHKDQVGAGTSEAYYKGLTSGSEKETTLPTAQAVGKFNLQLQLGLNNLSANPLIPSNLGIDSVIGTQLPNGTVLSMRDPSGTWHQPVYVSASQSWSSNIELKTDYGFWINIPSGTPTITIVGNVADSERTIPLYSGLNNLLGSTYPIQADLNSSKLGDALGTSGGKLSAYSDGRWREPVYANGAWSSLDYKLQPGKGFWVNRYESGGIIEWKYPKLY